MGAPHASVLRSGLFVVSFPEFRWLPSRRNDEASPGHPPYGIMCAYCGRALKGEYHTNVLFDVWGANPRRRDLLP